MQFILDGESFQLTSESVRRSVTGHVPENLREYWVEIDDVRWPVKQVISIATGVTDRQRFQSQSARRWLQKLGFPIGRDGETLPRPAAPVTAYARPLTPTADATRDVSAVLISCVKSKRATGAMAKDLYVSDYFAKMRRHAEVSGLPWFILSAEHGLLHPDQWVEPYEKYLPQTSTQYRRDWGNRVARQLEEAMGPLVGACFEVHAGSTYVEEVSRGLRPLGASVIDPLQGLTFGRRLAWYTQPGDAAPPPAATFQQPDETWDLPLAEVLERLRDSGSGWALDDLVEHGRPELGSPGLYSWWVDASGAADLTAGLGHIIAPGLIYAGLAGATRSGGSTSKNTLWLRIATMHLGGRNEFSTLRRSLGSILASAFDQDTIDEEQLTRWMREHLRVVTVLVADADSLGDLETAVLTGLDPPLNLAKVASTPVRSRLTELRKRFASR